MLLLYTLIVGLLLIELSRVIQLEPNSNVLDTGSETVRVTFTPRYMYLSLIIGFIWYIV